MNPGAPPRYCTHPLPARPFLPGVPDPPRPPEYTPLSPDWPADPARWRQSEDYQLGIDLFNARCYWESHEALEVVWKQLRAAPNHREAHAVQGVIQLAAAMVKHVSDHPQGVPTLLARARSNFAAAGAPVVMGVDLPALLEAVRTHTDGSAPPPTILLCAAPA